MSLKYSKDHEWVRLEGEVATVGITDFAQEQLGDVVFVELPDVGRSVAAHEQIAVVESVKAASEVYAPIGGEVTEANDALADDPSKVNADPLGDGWFFKLKVADKAELDGLMDEAGYKEFCESGGD